MQQLEKVQNKDRQTYPFVMIPKVFFTKFRPSLSAIGAYTAIKYFASTKTGTSEYTSIPTMAELVNLSTSSFQRAVRELVKKGAVRVRARTRRTPGGKRLSLPNLYEIVDLEIKGSDDSI